MAECRYVDWDGLVYYDGKVKQYIEDKFESTLKVGGVTTYEELPCPSLQNVNYLYKITDDFTSNEYFHKPGYIYKAGTIVQVSDIDNVYLYTIFQEFGANESGTPTITPDLEDITNQINKLTTDVEYLTQEQTTVNQYIAGVDKKIERLEDEMVTESVVQDAIQTAIDDLEIENLVNVEDIETLETDVSTMKSQVEIITGSTESLQTEVENLSANFSALDESVEFIDSSLEGTKQELHSVTTLVTEISNSYITKEEITNNYITNQQLTELNYITQDNASEIIEQKVTDSISTEITELVETTVKESIGDVSVGSIDYGTF